MTLSAESIRDSLAGIARPPLRRILELDASGDDIYLGHSRVEGPARIYGGQAVGQAVIAAARTVPADRPVHSIHVQFVYPGDTSSPVEYHVDRLRDGGSFTSRLVRAVQGGRTILTATASFQSVEDGLSHQPFRIDEWHLYEQEGSWMGHSRGLCRGHLYNREGTLVATTVQEGLLRIR